MKIAFVIYNGMSGLDFVGVYDGVARLKAAGAVPGLEWALCAVSAEVCEAGGLKFTASQVGGSLDGFDVLIVPGGPGSAGLAEDPGFVDWLKTGEACRIKAAVGTGALLLGAAGFLEDKRATTDREAAEAWKRYTPAVLEQRIVEDGGVITAGGAPEATAAIELGLYLCEKLAEGQAPGASQARPEISTAAPLERQPAERTRARTAYVSRSTRETHIELFLNLDGAGQAEIHTGLGFFDHMLTQIAVHGLFDLRLQADGDLEVDAHHTVEDVALALGKAFDQALGERAGIVRTASASVSMDEALAFVALDLAGRPYTVLETGWKTPAIGSIPTSLFDHFFESFASAARCNLHARLLWGRDDHHQAEALFKAFARALDAATQIDPRRGGGIPSSKGKL